jgi:predicted peroxiredoxin/TusA-related sulfurtransferase
MTSVEAPSTLDLRDLTITTAIGYAVTEALDELAEGDALDIRVGDTPAVLTDLKTWATATGNELVITPDDGHERRLRLTKHAPPAQRRHVAMIISAAGLEESLSPYSFALAAALEGARVSLYIQGPAVRHLQPGYKATLPWPMRPFSRFARRGLESSGHVAPITKLRQLQHLGGRVYACGPSMDHFGVDPSDLALGDVTICEYLTFMAVMQEADVQLYP